MREIKITKHAIEEYLKDNPNCFVPEKRLREKFIIHLSAVKKKEAKYHISENGNKIIIYNDVAIVYNDYTIITYWRVYHKKIKRLRLENKRRILSLI